MNPNAAGPHLEPSQDALRYILEAWEQAVGDGVTRPMLAYSAICVALADLVDAYGEGAVAELAALLPARVRNGEFTLMARRQ
jgi:hypothetical protein